jgi:flagellar biosynthesis/type III secretory pathway protein FliH
MSSAFVPVSPIALVRDFAPTSLIEALDAAREEAARMPPPPPEPDPMEETLRAVAAAAREDGFAAGRASMTQEVANRAAESLALIGKQLAASQAASSEIAAEASRGVARVALAMLDAALPGLAAQQSAALVADFAERLRPALAFLPEAHLHVAPSLMEEVRALVGDLAVRLQPDAALAPGDARASWQGGGAEFELSKRRAAIAGALSAAGLDIEDHTQHRGAFATHGNNPPAIGGEPQDDAT